MNTLGSQGLGQQQPRDLIPKAPSKTMAETKAKQAVLHVIMQKAQGNAPMAVALITKKLQEHAKSPAPWISMIPDLIGR